MISIIVSRKVNHPTFGKVTKVQTVYYDMSEVSDLLETINDLINQNYTILNLSVVPQESQNPQE